MRTCEREILTIDIRIYIYVHNMHNIVDEMAMFCIHECVVSSTQRIHRNELGRQLFPAFSTTLYHTPTYNLISTGSPNWTLCAFHPLFWLQRQQQRETSPPPPTRHKESSMKVHLAQASPMISRGFFVRDGDDNDDNGAKSSLRGSEIAR